MIRRKSGNIGVEFSSVLEMFRGRGSWDIYLKVVRYFAFFMGGSRSSVKVMLTLKFTFGFVFICVEERNTCYRFSIRGFFS